MYISKSLNFILMDTLNRIKMRTAHIYVICMIDRKSAKLIILICKRISLNDTKNI